MFDEGGAMEQVTVNDVARAAATIGVRSDDLAHAILGLAHNSHGVEANGGTQGTVST